jgi:hypothetical protein
MINTKQENLWLCCDKRVDKRILIYSIQTTITFIILGFCFYKLETEEECDKSAPYWGLMGTIIGFVFNKGSEKMADKLSTPRSSSVKTFTPQNSPTPLLPMIIRESERICEHHKNCSLSIEPIDGKPIPIERSPNQVIRKVSLQPSINQQQIDLLV